MLSFLRCRPLGFWLAFCVCGLALCGAAAVRTWTGEQPRAAAELAPSRDLTLEEQLPDLLSAVAADDGSATTQLSAFRAAIVTRARTFEQAGQPGRARAYRELARWCTVMLAPTHQDELGWRAEVLARAVRALGLGGSHPIPAAAWAGPPPTTAPPTVPPAAERVRRAIEAGS